MKILSLSSVELLPYLGSGKTRLMWTQGLAAAGHEVKVLTPANYELFPASSKAFKLRQAVGVFLAARKLMKKEHFDLVEFYGDQYWLLLLWAKKIAAKKQTLFVAHVDGIELHDMDKEQQYWLKRSGFKKWLYRNTHYRTSRFTFSLADRYVCGCKDDLDYVLQRKLFPAEHAYCIPPGIDDVYHTIPFQANKKPVIIFLGSWLTRKAVGIIPDVIKDVLRQQPAYSFHVYGAWAAKETILGAFPEDVKDRVTVFEKLPIETLKQGIQDAAILFFPSYSEGFGLATVEAMSCSCAVVTTRTGVGSELINNEHALICDFDDKEGMKNALNSLINNEELRESIAYKGYQKAKSFKWGQQVAMLNTVYSNWVDAKSEVAMSLTKPTV
ncbi:MAG: glycosyltransferase family 4 protein [Chitinophagaceae bacterium]